MEILRFTSDPHQCGYLPDESARMEYRIALFAQEAWYERILARGWRRFGVQFFRPTCALCQECRSIRLPVDKFQPNRSQRRNLQSNREIEVRIQPPTMTLDRLSLFRRYHANMAVRRGWPEREKTDESYWQTFVEGAGAFGREFLYFEQGRLIAVGLADVLPSSLSSVYFFHDPELRNRGLGIFSILTQMRFAQNHGLEAQYLGYWVEECQSMAYKRQFRPHQILQGRPGDLEDPIWLNSDPETE